MKTVPDTHMEEKDLNNLSKKELIRIIEDYQKKFFLSSERILPGVLDYRRLLEATSDIIYVIDSDGTLIYINAASKAFFASWSEQMLGDHYSKIIPPAEKERSVFVFNEVVHNGKIFENEIFKTYNDRGEKMYLSMSLSPIKSEDGSIIGLIGIMKNITEKFIAEKRAKEYSRILEIKVKEQLTQSQELRGLRDFNEDIINQAPVGIFVMDLSGIILSENPALKQIMGHNASDTLVGSNLFNEPGFLTSGLGRLYESCRNDKKTGRAFNIPYRTATGERDLIINATVVPVLDGSGSIEKMIFMIEDHTQQAAITAKIHETEKLSALGILASGVASELKNYINKIVMDLNFVENNLDEGSPSAEYIVSLHQELGRIKNITEQLSSLSISDNEVKDLCDLNKVLGSRQVELMINRLKNEGFEIIVTSPREAAWVRANQNQLQQLLIQFVENAEEAMPNKGTIRVSVETKNAGEGRCAIITISDTGIGIPEENFQKIFQPFFTTKGKQATGLGLMITSAIVQNLGGTIGLKSAPGEGTSFRIVLPIAEKMT